MRRNWLFRASVGCALFSVSAVAFADEKQTCIAAAEQGQSQRDDGEYRAARGSFLKCADSGCPRVIAQSCTKWLRELDESAPTIVLGAKDEQGNDLTDVMVTFDDAPFASTLTGRPMDADAGEHKVRFEQAGRVPVTQTLLLRAGEKARVVSVTLVPIGSDSKAEALAAPPVPQESALSPHHVTAGVMSLGAIGLAVTGIVFIAQSNQKKSSAELLRSGLSHSACSGVSSTMCIALDQDVRSQHDDANMATGLFVGAGVLAAGALATWFFWPKGEAPADAEPPAARAWIAPTKGGATVGVAGAFR